MPTNGAGWRSRLRGVSLWRWEPFGTKFKAFVQNAGKSALFEAAAGRCRSDLPTRVGDASTDALNFLQIRVLVGAASMSRVLTAGDDICADASHA